MRHFPTILGHEIRMLLVNPSTYVAAVLFLGLMGFIFTGILESYSSAPQDVVPAAVFFQLFWAPVLIMVPLLTMKCLAEERRMGTIETLLTTPVSTVEVVLGKYCAAYFLYLLLWACTGGFFYILDVFSGSNQVMDSGPLIGGYLFVAVSGMMFVAIGIFASSLSRSQALAGIISVTMIAAIIFGIRLLAEVQIINSNPSLAPVRAAVEYAQVFQHLDDFSRGVVDLRQLLFYASGTLLALIFSILGVEAKLLHS